MKIALSGRSGSGKSSVAEHLHTRYGFHRAHPGHYCRCVTKLLFATEKKVMLNRVNDAMRSIDEDVWIKVALRDSPPGAQHIVVDGVRFLSNYRYLEPMGFEFWAILTKQDPIARLKQRGQAFDPATDSSHSGEFEFEGIPFDKVIYNDRSLDDLKETIDAILCNR